jgi:hypothetical protein
VTSSRTASSAWPAVLARSGRALLAQGRARAWDPSTATTSFGDPFDDFDDHGHDHVYPTVFGAAGVEVVRSGRFTIDIQAAGAATFQSDDTAHSVSVNVGLNWY